MNLEERIARLIDPEVWETVDYLRVIELPLSAQEMTKSSLIAARRVIDGLNLTVEIRRSFAPLHGPQQRLTSPWKDTTK